MATSHLIRSDVVEEGDAQDGEDGDHERKEARDVCEGRERDHERLDHLPQALELPDQPEHLQGYDAKESTWAGGSAEKEARATRNSARARCNQASETAETTEKSAGEIESSASVSSEWH